METDAKQEKSSRGMLTRTRPALAGVLLAAACALGGEATDPGEPFVGESSGGQADGDSPSASETYGDPWTPGDDESESGESIDLGSPPLDCELPSGGPAVAWVAGWDPYVLKVDAGTATVEGIYTGPPQVMFGRRMSVSRNGDAGMSFLEPYTGERTIAVVRADVEDCTESNGQPGIQTSTGPDDLLDFADDECVAWSTTVSDDVMHAASLAWGRGTWSAEACRWLGADLWVGRTRNFFGPAEAVVSRLDGDSGETKDTVSLPGVSRIAQLAVDGDDNIWVAGDERELGRLNAETLAYESFDPGVPGTPANHRGLHVDADGRLWRCTQDGVERLSPQSGQVLALPLSAPQVDHCALDLLGQLWVASAPSPNVTLASYDLDTLDLVYQRTLATDTEGLATDDQGRVWRITSLRLERWDPVTDEVTTVALPSPDGPMLLDTLVTATAPAF